MGYRKILINWLIAKMSATNGIVHMKIKEGLPKNAKFVCFQPDYSMNMVWAIFSYRGWKGPDEGAEIPQLCTIYERIANE